MKKILILFLATQFWMCDTPAVSAPQSEPEIHQTLFSYNQEAAEIWLQVEVDDPQGIETIDTVLVTLSPLSSEGEAFTFLLPDTGTSGDLLPGNGIYTLNLFLQDGIPFAIYLMETRVVDMDGNSASRRQVVTIEEEVPPQILSVEMPEVFHLDPTEWSTLTIRVTIDDENGPDDIRYVRYAINTDYLTVDCEGNINPSPHIDNYYWDPSWFMVFSGVTEDGMLVYETNIPMRPVDDGMGGCGKTGLALFRIMVKDYSNYDDQQSGITLEIIKCGDGFCQTDYEDSDTCAEDCS